MGEGVSRLDKVSIGLGIATIIISAITVCLCIHHDGYMAGLKACKEIDDRYRVSSRISDVPEMTVKEAKRVCVLFNSVNSDISIRECQVGVLMAEAKARAATRPSGGVDFR